MGACPWIPKPGVELEVQLRGNPISVGANCRAEAFYEGGVLHGRREAPRVDSGPIPVAADWAAKGLGTFSERRGEEE
jgi:hypothetical protein